MVVLSSERYEVAICFVREAPRRCVDEKRLYDSGLSHEFCTGLGFPIHRVFVLSFLRCIQTVIGISDDGGDSEATR